MTREEMLKKYEEQGMMERGTIKITLEIPKVFERDFYERGFLSENKTTECFDRVLSDVNQGNTKTIGRYDKETLEMLTIAFANVEVAESEDAENKRLKDGIAKVKAEINEEKELAYADFERYKVECLGQDEEDVYDSLPQDDYRYGMERCLEIIEKHMSRIRADKESE